MPRPIAFSIIESPAHPNLSPLLKQVGYEEIQFPSLRKAIGALKKQQPDLVIADFIYAYANNYASNHISNLDSFLVTLQKYPDCRPRFVFVTSKDEAQYVEQLASHYDGVCGEYDVLVVPVDMNAATALLN